MHIYTLTNSGLRNELAETVVKEAATATAAKRSFMVLRLRNMNLYIEYVNNNMMMSEYKSNMHKHNRQTPSLHPHSATPAWITA